jgi:methyl-accepting chemotaxis protein
MGHALARHEAGVDDAVEQIMSRAAADAELLEAIARAWAVIEFQPDGTIVRANANFCGAVGYT